MLEIKFRVRGRGTKVVLGYETLMPDITNDGWQWAKSDYGRDWENGTYQNDYYIREQYTGFKIGEKELYEGDILMYPDTESEYVDVGIGEVKVAEQQLNSFWPVEFCEGEFGMNIKDGELMYGASDKNPQWVSLKRFFEDYISADKCEIIGNIHENSELIQ